MVVVVLESSAQRPALLEYTSSLPYMCVHVRACVRACHCVLACLPMRAHLHACVHVYVCECMIACVRACVRACACVHTCVCKSIRVCRCVLACVCEGAERGVRTREAMQRMATLAAIACDQMSASGRSLASMRRCVGQSLGPGQSANDVLVPICIWSWPIWL